MKERALPRFFCVGAQKAATSTLHAILKQHPQIYLPEIKETKFFVEESKYSKGMGFYLREYFSGWENERIAGEIDPDYMYFPYVAERIYKNIGGNVKLIFMLRNPVDRAYSHYWMITSRGQENLPFHEAIKCEKERIKQGYWNKLYYSYVDRGFYAQQIKRFLKWFPISNMIFIIFEEFIRNPKLELIKICNFLDVEPNLLPKKLSINANPPRKSKSNYCNKLIFNRKIRNIVRILIPQEKLRRRLSEYFYRLNSEPWQYPPLDEKTRRELQIKYKKDIKELENLINKDLSNWYI